MQQQTSLPCQRLITALLIVVAAAALLWCYESLRADIHLRIQLLTNWTKNRQQPAIWRTSVFRTRFITTAKPDWFEKQLNISEEDRKLQSYISSKSASVNQTFLNAVITMLANQKQVKLLNDSLHRLYNHFNSRFGYPVIIFHEADFKPHLEEVRAIGFNPLLNMSSIFFQQIDLSVPSSYLKKFGQPPKDACGGKKSFSYRSMCRFQAKMIYEEPMMRHFDYQWRLDDDSILGKKISFDVFAALRDANCSYGYYQTIIDTCAHNIFDVADSFIKSRRIRPTFFSQLKWNEVFFNNFEVSKIKIWRTKQYRDFVDHVDSLGGIYTYRWGDAPIKTLALSMFLPVSQIYQYTNISYGHHGVSSSLTTILFHNVKSPSVG